MRFQKIQILKRDDASLGWTASVFRAVLAVLCFQLAYTPLRVRWPGIFILGYAVFLLQLARQPTVRRAFYFGLGTALFCVAPQLVCFWKIFGPGALVLWLVLAFWVGLFTAVTQAAISRFGPGKAALLAPFLWTGQEYFRSELYYLKFSWLNIGYAFSGTRFLPFHFLGVYGVGFVAFVIAAIFLRMRLAPACAVLGLVLLVIVLPTHPTREFAGSSALRIGGVQLEFPGEGAITEALDGAVARHPRAKVWVLSEYALEGPVPDSLKRWCRHHSRYLIVGGKDAAPHGNYFDTAFVVGPDGKIVFRQAKSVPLQFFKDGLPAREQRLWNSPWGKVGICICYDLSYTRVTDRLVRMGAQLLVVPTMDVSEWGRHEHELHSFVAPVRAAEYGLPIFRLASSGISQAVNSQGEVLAETPFPGPDDMLVATLAMPSKGSVPWGRKVAVLSTLVLGGTLVILIVFSCWRRTRWHSPSQ